MTKAGWTLGLRPVLVQAALSVHTALLVCYQMGNLLQFIRLLSGGAICNNSVLCFMFLWALSCSYICYVILLDAADSNSLCLKIYSNFRQCSYLYLTLAAEFSCTEKVLFQLSSGIFLRWNNCTLLFFFCYVGSAQYQPLEHYIMGKRRSFMLMLNVWQCLWDIWIRV